MTTWLRRALPRALRPVLAGIGLLAAFHAVASAPGEVKVYTWEDYTDEGQARAFTQQTGVRLNESTYETNEILDAKLRMGGWGYDVVVPTASPFFANQLNAGLYQKIDRSRLRNWSNLDPKMLLQAAKYDPGNQYGVPFIWGNLGIGFNVAEVAKRMPDAPVDSLKMMFDPEILAKFKDCGIMMLDSPTEVLPAALLYLGLDPDSKRHEDLATAGAMLRSLRPYYRQFDSYSYINGLRDGTVCLAFVFPGGIYQARRAARKAGQSIEIGYRSPKEGSLFWMDMMAIPKDANNVENAHRYIDYMLEPAVAANTTRVTGYATTNLAAIPLLPPELAEDPLVYPPPEVRENFYIIRPGTPEDERERTRVWVGVARGR